VHGRRSAAAPAQGNQGRPGSRSLLLLLLLLLLMLLLLLLLLMLLLKLVLLYCRVFTPLHPTRFCSSNDGSRHTCFHSTPCDA
jgi:hypothetical protein